MDNFVKSAIEVLEGLSKDKSPDQVDDSWPLLSVFVELYEVGYVDAKVRSSFQGKAYARPRITLAGREYLAELKDSQKPLWKKGGFGLAGFGRLAVGLASVVGAIVAVVSVI